jgi:hypothetical protein
MDMRSRKWLCFLIALMTLALPFGVRAQVGPRLSGLEVDLWPEYDRSEMLVIYKAALSPEVPLPAELSFRIPTAAGEPNAVAERQVDGALFSLAYEREVQGEWAVVRFTATMPEIQLEYYDPSLEKDGPQRQFEYVWPGDYPVDTLVVQVQQPAGAEGLEISPDLGDGVQAQDGLVYYTAQVGSFALGENFRLTLAYLKDSDALSVELQNLPVQPSAPITTETPGRVTIRDVLPWVLGGLGLLLIGTGVWWYWQLRSEKQVAPPRRRRRQAIPPEVAEVEDEDDSLFCHQCGKRASPSDRFCRACGTRLRA